MTGSPKSQSNASRNSLKYKALNGKQQKGKSKFFSHIKKGQSQDSNASSSQLSLDESSDDDSPTGKKMGACNIQIISSAKQNAIKI